MKNRKKTWARIGLSLLIVGAILFGVGYAMGGFDDLKSTVEVRTGAYDADTIGALRVESISAEVIVERGDGDKVEITYFEGDREGVDVTVENGILIMRQYDDRRWVDCIGLTWHDDRNIVVRVPGELASAELFSTSGDVALWEVSVANELAIGTTSGDVEARGSAGSLTLSSTSGELDAREMAIAGDCKAGTTSGAIALLDLAVGGTVKATSTSGSVSISEVDAQGFALGSVSGDIRLSGAAAASGEGEISATTTSGEIKLSDTSAAAYTFGTVSGDVTGVLPGNVRDYTIRTGTVSGRNDLPDESYGGSKTIAVTTTSGDIRLTFEE